MYIPIIYNVAGEISNNAIQEYFDKKKNPFLYKLKPEGFHSRRGAKSNLHHHSTVVRLEHRERGLLKRLLMRDFSSQLPRFRYN